MTEIIAFTKVRLPFGWLGNMAPYPVCAYGVVWPTAEHLFQAERFAGYDPVREDIRRERSPMAAKMVARRNARRMVIAERGPEDINNMRTVLSIKLQQHPKLIGWLQDTGTATIVEDVTNRQRGSALFWGAAKLGSVWHGENVLGRLWMDLRAMSDSVAASAEEVS